MPELSYGEDNATVLLRRMVLQLVDLLFCFCLLPSFLMMQSLGNIDGGLI